MIKIKWIDMFFAFIGIFVAGGIVIPMMIFFVLKTDRDAQCMNGNSFAQYDAGQVKILWACNSPLPAFYSPYLFEKEDGKEYDIK